MASLIKSRRKETSSFYKLYGLWTCLIMQLSFSEYDLHVGHASKTFSMNIFHGQVVFRMELLKMQVPREVICPLLVQLLQGAFVAGFLSRINCG